MLRGVNESLHVADWEYFISTVKWYLARGGASVFACLILVLGLGHGDCSEFINRSGAIS